MVRLGAVGPPKKSRQKKKNGRAGADATTTQRRLTASSPALASLSYYSKKYDTLNVNRRRVNKATNSDNVSDTGTVTFQLIIL